jgi:AraC-like DNA-binding protein
VTHHIPVRPEWMFQVRSARQLFHCKVLDADRFEFERALVWLSQAAPAAASLQEADALREQLKLSAMEASLAFHRKYHRQPRRESCRGFALEMSIRSWSRYHDDPRVTFEHWITSFLVAFDATHPSSGVERAATILRTHFHEPSSLDALASQVGMSRSALTRAFRDAYSITCGEYLTRVRLRWFVEQARATCAKTGQLAVEAGYATYHNLSDALMRRTGLRPSAVKALSEQQAVELLRTQLSLSARRPRPAHVTRRQAAS